MIARCYLKPQLHNVCQVLPSLLLSISYHRTNNDRDSLLLAKKYTSKTQLKRLYSYSNHFSKQITHKHSLYIVILHTDTHTNTFLFNLREYS